MYKYISSQTIQYSLSLRHVHVQFILLFLCIISACMHQNFTLWPSKLVLSGIIWKLFDVFQKPSIFAEIHRAHKELDFDSC